MLFGFVILGILEILVCGELLTFFELYSQARASYYSGQQFGAALKSKCVLGLVSTQLKYLRAILLACLLLPKLVVNVQTTWSLVKYSFSALAFWFCYVQFIFKGFARCSDYSACVRSVSIRGIRVAGIAVFIPGIESPLSSSSTVACRCVLRQWSSCIMSYTSFRQDGAIIALA